MTTLSRLPLFLLSSVLAALSVTACVEDDPIDFDDPPEPPVVVNELSKDGDNFTAPRLPAGIHRYAVRFSESELLDFDGRELTGISIYVHPTAEPDYIDVLVRSGGDTQPGREVAIAGEDTPTDLGQFITYTFDEPVVIDAGAPLWLEAEVRTATAQQTIGCDAGPRVPGGDWLWSEDRYLPFSERAPGESVNWNIRGVLR